MTGKEAIKILCKFWDDVEYKKKLDNKRLLEAIITLASGVRVLEILKEHIYKSDTSISILLDDLRCRDAYYKVEEWLENEHKD